VIEGFREGVVVKPYERLSQDQVKWLDEASMSILADPGIWCYSERVAQLFQSHGAQIREDPQGATPCWRVSIPAGLIREAVAQAPSRVVLGARDPANRLLLEAEVPRVYFGSGSETNVWLDTEMEEFVSVKDGDVRIKAPRHRELRGSAELLSRAARLCNELDNLDFFIRPVNIQDPEITLDNHDVNKFFASLNNITKHVQGGLTSLDQLGSVLRLAEIVAGGPEALRENPVISFIACVFKSPLQLVADTADKVFAFAEAGMPIVISASPQGGSTAAIQEAGLVAQINAELLTGIALVQLVRPGTPSLYGSVPLRSRMDDLHDLYGCPESNQYNIDCVQMARHYGIPCYSSAGAGDAKVPGMQATFEKMLTHLYMAMSGAQYIHYAFGLLDRTSTFSPLQAVLDDEQIDKIKHLLRAPQVDPGQTKKMLAVVRKVMTSSHRLFARHARKAIQAGEVSLPYAFESKDLQDRVVEKGLERLAELEARPGPHLDEVTVNRIFREVPGLLPRLRQTAAA
jgi:trimethylamine--corrinoid protein Co-methyltransferase